VLPTVVPDQTPTTTATPATTAAAPSSLPVTGAASTVLALGGLGAILIGAGLVFLGRREAVNA